jgi:hypothetical protein
MHESLGQHRQAIEDYEPEVPYVRNPSVSLEALECRSVTVAAR